MGRLDQAQHQFHQGRLAGPVVSDQRQAFAGGGAKVDIANRFGVLVALAHAFQFKGRFGHSAYPSFAVASAGGSINGALSVTPPGCRAGNRDCAQRTI